MTFQEWSHKSVSQRKDIETQPKDRSGRPSFYYYKWLVTTSRGMPLAIFSSKEKALYWRVEGDRIYRLPLNPRQERPAHPRTKEYSITTTTARDPWDEDGDDDENCDPTPKPRPPLKKGQLDSDGFPIHIWGS